MIQAELLASWILSAKTSSLYNGSPDPDCEINAYSQGVPSATATTQSFHGSTGARLLGFLTDFPINQSFDRFFDELGLSASSLFHLAENMNTTHRNIEVFTANTDAKSN